MKLTIIFALFLFAVGCASSAAPIADGKSNEKPSDTTTKSEKKAEDTTSESTEDKKANRISLADAKKAFDAGEAVFVDTRGANFFENEHVKGAINVPSSEFDANYKNVPKDKKIITYCS